MGNWEKNNREDDRYLGLKRLKNAQLHDENMRSSGDWGRPQQAEHVYCGCTDALLAIISVLK